VLSAQELSDQIEIPQVLNRYFRAVDTKNWDLLDQVFMPEARLHYDTPGEIETTYQILKPIFATFTETFRFMQHSAAQMVVEVDRDTALATCNLHAVHVQESLDGDQNTWVVYGNYRDELVRTASGWRISVRDFVGKHTEGQLLPPHEAKCFVGPHDSKPTV
jgi:hypothetical protein